MRGLLPLLHAAACAAGAGGLAGAGPTLAALQALRDEAPASEEPAVRWPKTPTPAPEPRRWARVAWPRALKGGSAARAPVRTDRGGRVNSLETA